METTTARNLATIKTWVEEASNQLLTIDMETRRGWLFIKRADGALLPDQVTGIAVDVFVPTAQVLTRRNKATMRVLAMALYRIASQVSLNDDEVEDLTEARLAWRIANKVMV